MEILDSRGRPTVLATCELRGGVVASASVPSGASTGAAEALELRDGDASRYGGLGVRKAVANVNEEIAANLVGSAFAHQAELDATLLKLDGTSNKSRLGANAILAVSIAFARAHAMEKRVPLYQHFADIAGIELRQLPRMTINLFSGGKHAGGQVAIQDLLVVPLASTIDAGLAQTYATFYAAAKLTNERFQTRLLRADEGGLAPPFTSVESMIDSAVESIRAAGLQPGQDVSLAMDVASSHFFEGATYTIDGAALDSEAMVTRIASWLDRAPILSVEDGLSEEDWSHWPALLETIGSRAIVVGDDFLCTNPARIRRAVETHAASALLLKVNQIGTLTEANEARRLARDAGWNVTVSARSGETEDNWLADLAVGWSADQIKIGSITQSERLAKYNRLLAIEQESALPVARWPE
jgi:enolase